MSIEGIWKIEMRAAYGREPIGTAFLKGGRYLGGSADHYSIGSYSEKNGEFKAKVTITQYGGIRTLFGARAKKIKARIVGKVKHKHGKTMIIGNARPSKGKGKGKGFDIQVYLTRMGDLD